MGEQALSNEPGWEGGSRPVSRVLSGAQEAHLSSPGAIIHLGCTSPHTSSDLPGDSRGPRFATLKGGSLPYLVLLRVGFTVPPALPAGAVRSYRTFSPLPPPSLSGWRYVFCGTFRGLAPPGRYPAPCPVEPGLSSAPKPHDAAIARPAPDRVVSVAGRRVARVSLFQHGMESGRGGVFPTTSRWLRPPPSLRPRRRSATDIAPRPWPSGRRRAKWPPRPCANPPHRPSPTAWLLEGSLRLAEGFPFTNPISYWS